MICPISILFTFCYLHLFTLDVALLVFESEPLICQPNLQKEAWIIVNDFNKTCEWLTDWVLQRNVGDYTSLGRLQY